MSLTPSTPPGSPALTRLPSHDMMAGPREWLSRFSASIQTAYREPLDRSGFAAAATYGGSAISSALAVAVNYTAVLEIPLMRQIIPLWYHFGGRWLWALPIVFGLASKQRLPRAIAGLGILTMGVWSAWSLFPIPMSSFFPIRVVYIAGALLLALPPLLRFLWGDSDAT